MDQSFISVLDAISDSPTVKKSASALESASWEVNKILTIDSLRQITSDRLKMLYIKVCMQYVESKQFSEELDEVTKDIVELKNAPVGGGWI